MANWLSKLFRPTGRHNAGAASRQLGSDDISYLRSAGYPESVVRYYTSGEWRIDPEINSVRTLSVKDMRVENDDAIPCYVIAPMGYLSIGSTVCGDAYCLDLNTRNADGEPAVVLVSHEEIQEGCTPEEARQSMVRIADSFDEFIARYKASDLPSGYYDAKHA